MATTETTPKPKRAPRGTKTAAYVVYAGTGTDDSQQFTYVGEITARNPKLALSEFLEGGGKVSSRNAYLVLDKAKNAPLSTKTKIEVS